MGTGRVSEPDRSAPVEAVVALGGNVGDRIGALRRAVETLDALPEAEVVATSAVYETEAMVLPGTPPQPDHLNAALLLRTTLGPWALLRRLHAVERAAGRDRRAPRWAPRPLDLDLLLYGDAVIDRDGLAVPHPGLAVRRFVLAPLADLGPDRRIAGLGRTVGDLLAACPDSGRIERTGLALR